MTFAFLILCAIAVFKAGRREGQAEARANPAPQLQWGVAATSPAKPFAPKPFAHLRSVKVAAPRRSLRPPPAKPHPAAQECAEPVSAALPKPPATPAPDAFVIRLTASPETPRGYAYADVMRDVLARQGALAARGPGRVVWAVDHQFTARLPDGSSLAVAGGIGQTRLSLRALTPESCRTIFAMAEAARAGLAAPGLDAIRPGTAAGPRDLCNRLAPAFAAWRWQAPPRSPGLEDLDRRRVSLAGAGAAAPTAPAGQGALSRRALFY